MNSPGRKAAESLASAGPGRIFRRPLIGLLLVLVLLAVVAAEEYFIFALRDRIARQNDQLKSISVELQTLRNERNALNEELSSMKKLAGDKNNGNTPERNN